MYRLQIFHEGSSIPAEIQHLDRAAAVLEAVPALLRKHPDCARVEVFMGPTRLFIIDCEGNRLEA